MRHQKINDKYVIFFYCITITTYINIYLFFYILYKFIISYQSFKLKSNLYIYKTKKNNNVKILFKKINKKNVNK